MLSIVYCVCSYHKMFQFYVSCYTTTHHPNSHKGSNLSYLGFLAAFYSYANISDNEALNDLNAHFYSLLHPTHPKSFHQSSNLSRAVVFARILSVFLGILTRSYYVNFCASSPLFHARYSREFSFAVFYPTAVAVIPGNFYNFLPHLWRAQHSSGKRTNFTLNFYLTAL